MTDPAEPVRRLYDDATRRILAALSSAVADTLAADDPAVAALLIELRLTREVRAVVAGLNAAVPAVVDAVLAAAADEGRKAALADV